MIRGTSYCELPENIIAIAARLDQLSGVGVATSSDGRGSRIAKVEVIARVKSERGNANSVQSSQKGRPAPPPGEFVWVKQGRDVFVKGHKGLRGLDQSMKQLCFRCDTALPQNTSNLDVSMILAPQIIDEWLWEGFNVSVLTMGGSGCGKTHTLFGPNKVETPTQLQAKSENAHALVWSVLRHLFSRIKEESHLEQVVVGVSFWGVTSCDNVVDFLKADSVGRGKKVLACASFEEAFQVLTMARESIQTRETSSDASESMHSFIRITLVNHSSCSMSELHLVELSGKPNTLNKLESAAQCKLNLQLMDLETLVSELSSSYSTPRATATNTFASRNSVFIKEVAPLLAMNTKCFLFAAVHNDQCHLKDTAATLKLASNAGKIKTACIRSSGEDTILKCRTWGKFEPGQYFASDVREQQEGTVRETQQMLEEFYLSKDSSSSAKLEIPRGINAQTGALERQSVLDILHQDLDAGQQRAAACGVDSSKDLSRANIAKVVDVCETDLASRSAKSAPNTEQQQRRLGQIHPRILRLNERLRQLEREVANIDLEYAKERTHLLRDKAELEKWCNQAESDSMYGTVMSDYISATENARQIEAEQGHLVSRLHSRAEQGVSDAVGFVRDWVKLLRDEINVLDHSLASLRKKRQQIALCSRFQSQVDTRLCKIRKKSLQMQKALDQEMAMNHMVEEQVKCIEIKRNGLATEHERCHIDREESSLEATRMRKFISRATKSSEERAILQFAGAKGTDAVTPEGNGLTTSLQSLLKQLDSLVTRTAPHLLPHISTIQLETEKIGKQVLLAKNRSDQLTHAMYKLINVDR